jgi:hypothetical protein
VVVKNITKISMNNQKNNFPRGNRDNSKERKEMKKPNHKTNNPDSK